MIKKISYPDIVKNLVKVLEDYSGLRKTSIVNLVSISGVDLGELISESEQYSINASDSFLLFELLENNSDNYVTKGSKNDQMEYIQSYDFHIIVYGNNAPVDCQKISALFKQENIALFLRDNGIYIKGVSPIDPRTEFINNTLIVRRDLMVRIYCRNEFDNIGIPTDYFDKKQKIGICVKKI